MLVYHGSNHIIEKPVYNGSKRTNDYGYGFYTTESLELAKEWACADNRDGFANRYEADLNGLSVLNLNAPKYNILLEEWNHDQDHVHIMFRAHPNTELSKFINAYKSASSRLIKKDFPEVRRKLWKEMFWSRSYCLLTTGGAPIETIRKYIENQDR